MSFQRPDLLYLAALLPALLAAGVLAWWRRRRRVAAALGDAPLVARLAGEALTTFPRRRLLLLAAAGAALGVAAAGPTWGLVRVETRAVAADVVLVMDVSRSMLAEDVAPNRLERARLLAARLVRELSGDRLGLVVFAGRAYTLSPLTVDAGALNLYLNALDPEIVSQGGSSLASAIRQAVDLARGGTVAARERAVVILSDGEAHDEEAEVLAAAEMAAREGITLHTVGVGTAEGARIAEQQLPDGRILWTVGPDGEIVVSRLGEALLRRVADAAGGRYVHLDGGNAAAAVLASLGEMERSATGETGRWVPRERAWLFMALALLLLAVDAWLALPPGTAGERRSRWPRLGFGRRAGAAALVLALLAAPGAGIGDVERGNRRYREGRWAEAVEAYTAALAEGRASPTLHYNLGTALLRLNRWQEAEEHLRAALQSVDPELRRRALYNLGNRYLVEYRTAPSGSVPVEQLDAAVEAYRRALRLDPGDADAKWNLELALREQQDAPTPDPRSGAGGQDEEEADPEDAPGGAGGGAPGSGGAGAGSGPQGPADAAPMSRDQAERILAAAEQDEAALTRATLRRGERRTPVRRNW